MNPRIHVATDVSGAPASTLKVCLSLLDLRKEESLINCPMSLN